MKLNLTVFFISLSIFIPFGWIILNTTSCSISSFWSSLNREKLFLLLYAIFCTSFFSIENALISDSKKKALEIGYKSHKLTYKKNGEKKLNFHYLLSACSWGIPDAFLMYTIVCDYTNHTFIAFIITLIIGLAAGILTADAWGRTMYDFNKKKKNDTE